MVDVAHLEKMGEELKCPICLSLLRSTASLPCSHMFCGSCISESMRANSNCPVCKVPVHRREVRPAPHMDNLVSIYRNMEAAAGVIIFATQSAVPQPRIDDAGDNNSEEASAARRSRKKLTSKKSNEDKQIARYDSCNLPKKSSISSNKRVHVTPYPTSETPIQHHKFRKLEPHSVDHELKTEVVTSTQKIRESEKYFGDRKTPHMDNNSDPVLTPFFCLREDDDDAEAQGNLTSQQTTDTDTFLTQLPRFSDIKDSDDEHDHVKKAPSNKDTPDQVLDSEMFEWTQRPCSPELFSTPIKKHVGRCSYSEKPKSVKTAARKKKPVNKVKLQANPGKTGKQTYNRESITANPEAKDLEDVSLCSDAAKSETPVNQTAVSHNTISFSAGKTRADSVIEDDLRGRKQRKRKQLGHAKIVQEVTTKITDVSQNQENKTEKHQVKEYACLKVKPFSVDTFFHQKDSRPMKNKNLHITQGRSSVVEKENRYVSNTRKTVGWVNDVKNGKEAEDKTQNQKAKPNRIASRSNTDNNENLHIDKADEKHSDPVNSGIEDAPGNKPENFNTGNQFLKKCSSTAQIKCAFCQSGEVTEVSGELMHYFNGKPVTQDYNGGIGLVHSHKHCTEWAPNVYFENGTAINLSSELARSKRIKCCCCTLKGASLGCYERTCRKSFHFTCAKTVPQCRWDPENFVMLCPLHAVSKFQCEDPDLKKQKKRRLNFKDEPHEPGMNHTKHGGLWRWPQGSYKWHFCCSAMSSSEKEIVSIFTKLASVSVSKTWASNVTHVITSCDETGACRRTLKVLMGILEGKWIVNIDWLKACISAGSPVNEEPFEITVDNHGIRDGPRLGRLRAMDKKPKLFCGFKFYFMGDFSASYKGYLQDLVIAAGGTVLLRRPLSKDALLRDESQSVTYVIYGCELTDKQNALNLEETVARQKGEAKLLADDSGAKVASNSWILDSIAACSLKSLE